MVFFLRLFALDDQHTLHISRAILTMIYHISGKQEFRRTDFGSRLLAAGCEGGGDSEGEGGEDRCG